MLNWTLTLSVPQFFLHIFTNSTLGQVLKGTSRNLPVVSTLKYFPSMAQLLLRHFPIQMYCHSLPCFPDMICYYQQITKSHAQCGHILIFQYSIICQLTALWTLLSSFSMPFVTFLPFSQYLHPSSWALKS